MKKTLLVLMSACSMNAFTQPLIQDGSNIPSAGYSAPVTLIVSSSTDITNGGANHTWDFGSYTFSSAGTLNVINPSTAPMGSSFATSNYAFTFGGTYSFFNVGGSKMEVQAWTIVSAGSGNDYSPNPRTLMKFPFSYNDSATDDWQKVGGSNNSVKLYYDSYGTLITPAGTFNNVVRIRENYGNGANDYTWYILNPLIPVAIYDHNTNTLYHIAATPTTNLEAITSSQPSFDLYPNPAKNEIKLSGLPLGSKQIISDLTGNELYTAHTNSEEATINCTDFACGIYIISVEVDGTRTYKKLLINH